MSRLHSSDLLVLGVFLYGTRWQSQLARALHCSDRLVRHWKAGTRPISVKASRRIEDLVVAKHSAQMRRTRAYYLDMIGSLTETKTREHLLMMDLTELRVDEQLRRAALETVVEALPLVGKRNKAPRALTRLVTKPRPPAPPTPSEPPGEPPIEPLSKIAAI